MCAERKYNMKFAFLQDLDQSQHALMRVALVQPNGSLLNISQALLAWARTMGTERTGLKERHVPQPNPLGFAMGNYTEVAEMLQQAEAAIGQTPEWATCVYPADTPLLAPLPRPTRIFGIGRNYAEHARELGNAVPEDEPIVFLKASQTVIGPNAAIEIPEGAGRVDFEGELLVVIGMGGKHIAEADALKHIAGYSVFNDVTAREIQRAAQDKKRPWFTGKSLDTFGPLGPYLVTPDEVPDPHNLRLTLTVNGETRQNDTTGSMIYSIPFLIAHLSRYYTLEPGDVIATGTPSGVGPIVPGDTVTVTVENVGTLSNPVVSIAPI